MKKEFVMRGQTESGLTEQLEFGGKQTATQGWAYRLTEFEIFPSTNFPQTDEMAATITAGKTAVTPTDPNFNDEGLIGSTVLQFHTTYHSVNQLTIINDTFLITQNLILMVINTSTGAPVNWQCRFKSVKMTASEEAAVNYKQFAIYD
jgi:hypothetical protein